MAIAPKPLFDAESIVADWLGDIMDGHPRVGNLARGAGYDHLRAKAKVLLADFAENKIQLIPPPPSNQSEDVNGSEIDSKELLALAEWCRIEREKLGALDGYDYRSGEEFGLRRAQNEVERRSAAIPAPTKPAPTKSVPASDDAAIMAGSTERASIRGNTPCAGTDAPPDDVRSALADRLSKLSVCLDYRTPHPHTRFVAGLAMSEEERDLIVAALRSAPVSAPAQRAIALIDDYDRHGSIDHGIAFELKRKLSAVSIPAVGVTREAIARTLWVSRGGKPENFDKHWKQQRHDLPSTSLYVPFQDCLRDADAILAFSPAPDAMVSEPFAWAWRSSDDAKWNVSFEEPKLLVSPRGRESLVVKSLYTSPQDVGREAAVPDETINIIRALGPPDPSDEEFEQGWAACQAAVVAVLSERAVSARDAVIEALSPFANIADEYERAHERRVRRYAEQGLSAGLPPADSHRVSIAIGECRKARVTIRSLASGAKP